MKRLLSVPLLFALLLTSCQQIETWFTRITGRQSDSTVLLDSVALARREAIRAAELAFRQAVADSIRNQPSETFNDFPTPPTPFDSITVIRTQYGQKSGAPFRQYTYIDHSRSSSAQQWFSADSLRKRFERFMTEVGGGKIAYERALQRCLAQKVETHIDSSITRYTGFWIHVYPHDGKFYLEDDPEWKYAWHLNDSLYMNLTKNGPRPVRIVSFKELSDGGFMFQTTEEKMVFTPVKGYRDLYRMTLDGIFYKQMGYAVPADTYFRYDIIRYTGNTPDRFIPIEKEDEQ